MEKPIKIFLVLMLICSVIPLSQAMNLSMNVIYHFSLNSTATNLTGSNTFTLSGYSIIGSDKKVGNGSVYTGVASSTAILNATTAMPSSRTVSFWFNQTTNATDQYGIVSFINSGTTDYYVAGTNNGKKLMLGKIGAASNQQIWNANETFALNTWHHAVFVDNAGNAPTIYLDSSLQNLTTSNTVGSDFNPSGTLTMRLGNPATFDNKYNGTIDQVTVWDRQLNASEVLAIYQNESAGYGYPWEQPTCTPNWSCSSYGSCAQSNVSACLNVTDGNSCGESFSGNLSDYNNNACGYVPNIPVCAISNESNPIYYADVNITCSCDTGDSAHIYFENATPPTTDVYNAVTTATYTTNNLENTTYYYRGRCTYNGSWSNYSTTYNFTWIAPPIVTTPICGSTPDEGTNHTTQQNITCTCDTGDYAYIYFQNETPPGDMVQTDVTTVTYETNITAYGTYYYRGLCEYSGWGFYSNYSDTVDFIYSAPPCVPDWICNDYGSCGEDNVSSCLNVTDLELCGVLFEGNLTDYDNTSCGYEAPCVPDWYCDSFDDCNILNISSCLSMTDNSSCGVEFNGTITDYDVPCEYSCETNWTCASFTCLETNVSRCDEMTDLNECGFSFGGNISDYDEVCEYTPENTGPMIAFLMVVFVSLALLWPFTSIINDDDTQRTIRFIIVALMGVMGFAVFLSLI